MAELKGSKTEKNLMAAFAGESQARNKYTYYASKAKKDGFVQIANILKKPQTTKKSTPKFGLNSCTEARYLRPRKISRTRLTAKTTSGPICMPVLPKRQEKRASMR